MSPRHRILRFVKISLGLAAVLAAGFVGWSRAATASDPAAAVATTSASASSTSAATAATTTPASTSNAAPAASAVTSAPASTSAKSAAPAATTSPAPIATPTASGHLLPYAEFADLQYFKLSGTNQVILEFYDGSGVTITDIQCDWQKGGTTPVLQVRIFGQKGGVESKKFFWDTEGNAVYSFDVGAADKAALRLVYIDDKGAHDIPSAGLLDKPFEPEHPATPVKGGPGQP